MCIYISKYIWYYRLCRYTLYIHIYLLAISSCINAKWGLSRLYSSLRKIGAEIPFTFHPLALGLFFWKLSSFFLCYGCQHQFARLRSTLYTVYLVWSENDLHLHTSSDICMYRLQVLDYGENLVLKNVPIIKFYYKIKRIYIFTNTRTILFVSDYTSSAPFCLFANNMKNETGVMVDRHGLTFQKKCQWKRHNPTLLFRKPNNSFYSLKNKHNFIVFLVHF